MGNFMDALKDFVDLLGEDSNSSTFAIDLDTDITSKYCSDKKSSKNALANEDILKLLLEMKQKDGNPYTTTEYMHKQKDQQDNWEASVNKLKEERDTLKALANKLEVDKERLREHIIDVTNELYDVKDKLKSTQDDLAAVRKTIQNIKPEDVFVARMVEEAKQANEGTPDNAKPIADLLTAMGRRKEAAELRKWIKQEKQSMASQTHIDKVYDVHDNKTVENKLA